MVIVIGATGFIGIYTVEKLISEGYKVLATGRNKEAGKMLTEMGAQFLEFDINNLADYEKLPTKDVEGVIHLAGLLPANARVDLTKDENAADYIQTNVIATINILEYCRKNGIKKIIGSSSYSDVKKAWKKGVALTEEEPRDFEFTGDHAVYVISKNAANDMIEYYNQQHGLQGSVFRFPPVYGVGPHSEIYVNGKYYKTGIQTFIDNAEKGLPIEIWGDPTISRDIIYVKDVAQAFVDALRSPNSKGLYNMTSSTQLTLEDQVKIIIKVFSKDKKSEIVYRPELKNNTPSFLFSMEKAKRDFGFVPKFTSYEDIMIDYKKELESGRFNRLIKSRHKVDENEK